MSARRAQVLRLRRVALAAVVEYPLPDGRLTFVDHGENTTFRHDSAAGRYLVRVHRPQRHGQHVDAVGRNRIRDRLAPGHSGGHGPGSTRGARGGIGDRAGALRGGPYPVCSVLRWMDGRIHGGSRARSPEPAGWGDGPLHNQADAWTPPRDFLRIRWDHETFFGNAMVYGDTPAAGCWALLPVEVRSRFEAVAARMADIMALDGGEVGLIHADLHLGQRAFPPRPGRTDRLR